MRLKKGYRTYERTDGSAAWCAVCNEQFLLKFAAAVRRRELHHLYGCLVYY